MTPPDKYDAEECSIRMGLLRSAIEGLELHRRFISWTFATIFPLVAAISLALFAWEWRVSERLTSITSESSHVEQILLDVGEMKTNIATLTANQKNVMMNEEKMIDTLDSIKESL